MNHQTDNQTEYCPMCSRACPADTLSCGRGRAYFGGGESPDGPGRQHHGHEGGGHHGGHGCHERHEHGRHGEHCHPPIPDDGSLSSLFARCSHTLHRAGGRRMSQERVLRILSQKEGGMGQRQLQELLGVQSGSLSELVSKLEAKGLLTRVRDGADKRSVTLLLTDAGRDAASLEASPDPFAVLSNEEQEQLRALLQKLLDSQETCCAPKDERSDRPCG